MFISAVIGTEPLDFDQFQDFIDTSPFSLFYGGFLYLIDSPSKIYKNKNTIYGYVLDNNLKINSTLDFLNQFTIPSFNLELGGFNRNYGLFTLNNTFIEVIPDENNSTSWQIISTEIIKFLPDGKIIFINLIIFILIYTQINEILIFDLINR